jgi:hypothetical protein
MFTLDRTRKKRHTKWVTDEEFTQVDTNGTHKILRSVNGGLHWLSVPCSTGGFTLYPMRTD